MQITLTFNCFIVLIKNYKIKKAIIESFISAQLKELLAILNS